MLCNVRCIDDAESMHEFFPNTMPEQEEFHRTPSCGRHIARDDLIFETELRVAREKGIDIFLCPCCRCHRGRRYSIDTIRTHLQVYRRDIHLIYSMLGGDPVGGFPSEGIWLTNSPDFPPDRNVFDDAEVGTAYDDHLDLFHDVQQHLFDAFDQGDVLREGTPHENDAEDETLEDVGANLENLEVLMSQATKPLYEGLNVNLISATIVLINMAVIHGVSNAYMDELLKYMGTILFPRGNVLPLCHRDAKKVIQKLGLNYEIIECCPGGCILYKKEMENLTHCPKCSKSRFIPGSDRIPARVMRYFPLIPRLLRMFRSAEIAQLLRYHVDNPNVQSEEVMKSVADSPAWRHVEEAIDPAFSTGKRNLRFGLALNGVNPFRHNNTQHSMWPILMVIYNLPPYLVMKKFFIQLCILISGKESPTNENIDVFLRPLVDELKLLWDGIIAQDFSQPAKHVLYVGRKQTQGQPNRGIS
jgi:hypothetical protein